MVCLNTIQNVSFADDLMIFTKGDMESFVGVKKFLQLFYIYSGLQLNNEKSKFFNSRISRIIVELIQAANGFKSGTLLVKYLEVPLLQEDYLIRIAFH